MSIKTIYEDNDVLVIDKPAGMVVFDKTAAPAGAAAKTLIDLLLEQFPELKNVGEVPRYGIVHRLDKDTSGILLVAKTSEALIFLQKQFKNREVGKKYLTLVTGTLPEDTGIIHTLIGRSKNDPRKQKATWLQDKNPKGKREAITHYKVLKKFADYTLIEAEITTGRKHQIRAHMAYIHHPIAGDNMYGFKDSPKPKELHRQFLHAAYLKITLPNGQTKEFHSELPEELQRILKGIASRV